MSCIRRRVAWLVGVHALLATTPLLGALFSFDISTLPILWLAYSIPIAGLMLLALWAALGGGRLVWRIVGLLTGCGYLAIWSTLTDWLIFPVEMHPVAHYFEAVVPYAVVGLIVAGMFIIVRRWFHIREVAHDASTTSPQRMQFSVFHLLVLMSFVAIILSLVRAARQTGPSDETVQSWAWWAAGAILVVTFFANTVSATFAALGTSAVKRNCVLVAIASMLLGVAVAFSMRSDQVNAWHFAGGILSMILPTIIILASLLWLRPCGIRLVRRRELTS